jgi:hypothetical protein
MFLKMLECIIDHMKKSYSYIIGAFLGTIGVIALLVMFSKTASADSLPIVSVFNSAGSGSVSPQAAQQCNNFLFPIAVGQEWQYQTTALSRTDNLNMSILSVDQSQGNILVTNQSTGSTKRVEVKCDGDIITNFPFMNLNAMFGDLVKSDVEATYQSGVLIPNEKAFLDNNWALSWSSQYQVSGNTTLNNDGNQLTISMEKTPISLTCQTIAAGDAAFETVTVKAGTYRALKVVCTEQGKAVLSINGIKVPSQIEARSNQWFAPNIGMIKMQVDSAKISVFGISFSVLIDNNFELNSFVPAP